MATKTFDFITIDALKKAATIRIEDTDNLVTMLLKVLVDKIYPVNRIIPTTDNVNPGTYLPGTTWEPYATGRTLIGVGESDKAFAAGATGGESEHKLVENEMPNHNHTITDNAGNHYHSLASNTKQTGDCVGMGWDRGAINGIGGISTGDQHTVTFYEKDYAGHQLVSDAGSHNHTINKTGGGASSQQSSTVYCRLLLETHSLSSSPLGGC